VERAERGKEDRERERERRCGDWIVGRNRRKNEAGRRQREHYR
jgi:hypothetical protein